MSSYDGSGNGGSSGGTDPSSGSSGSGKKRKGCGGCCEWVWVWDERICRWKPQLQYTMSTDVSDDRKNDNNDKAVCCTPVQASTGCVTNACCDTGCCSASDGCGGAGGGMKKRKKEQKVQKRGQRPNRSQWRHFHRRWRWIWRWEQLWRWRCRWWWRRRRCKRRFWNCVVLIFINNCCQNCFQLSSNAKIPLKNICTLQF